MAKKTTPPITKLPDTSQFDALIKQSKDEAVKAGVLPDYEAAQEEAGGRIKEYGGIDAMYSIEAPDFYDAYEDYVDRNTLRGGQFDTDALNAIRAENQSNWEQTGNALGRLAVNIVPQIIGSTAAMLDIPGYYDEVEAANNSIVNWADSIKQQTNEALPIYEENPGGSMQMGDFAWWISRGEGLVESIASFAASGWGAGKLASLGGKALARGLASAAMSAKTAKTIGGAVGQLGAATMMNQAEAVLEATQVYKTTYDRARTKGKSDIQAKEEAARAAATTMNINRANILLNLTSAKAFLTPMKATRNLLTAPTLSGTIGKVVGEGAQEALEETINLVGQKAGEAKGRGEKDYMKKGMEAIGTMEGLEAAFLGAIGGVGQTAITSALQSSKYGPGAVVDAEGNKISYNENLRQQYQKQQKVIEELKANGVKVTDALMNVKERAQFEEELEVARIMGDNAKVAELQEKLFETTALKAFESGTTDILIEQLKEEAAQDPNVVGPEYIANAQQALKDLKQLEDVYNNFEEYSNVGEIFSNRAAQQRVNRQANVTNTLTKNAQVSYAQKVRDIAQKYNFTEEYDQINKVEGEEVGRTKQTREVPLNYVLSDLDNNQGDTEENQKTYDKFLKEVKNTPEYQMYNGYQAQTEVVNAQLEQIQKDFQEMTSPAYQQKFAEKQAEKAKLKELNAQLVNATSIPEIEKLKAQTTDAVFQGLADGKIAEIEKSNAAEAKRKQTELTMRQLRAKVATATNDNYDEIQKSIEDADISQANKDQLRVEHTARLENLNNPQAAVTNPLSAFQQGDNLDEEEATAAAVQQNNKALSTKLPEDLPTPDEETTQVEQQVINAAEAIIQNDKSTVVGQDENGNLVYSYSKSNEGHNKGAFLSREFNQTETLGTVSREEIEDNLTDNTKVLDPDELTAGTKLIISIDHDYEGDKYDPESTTREVISWPARLAELRALAAERNVDLTALPEYIAEVPIKVTTEDGQTVFYVHDNAWYKAENLDNTPEAIAEDKRKNFVVRANVVKKGVVKSQVEYKSFGRLFKTADGKSIPLTDAMPDENLIVAVGKDGGYDYGNATGLPADATIVNKQETQAGRPYAVVKVGPKEYMALPLERARLSDEVVDSIIFAIEAHLRNDENDPAVQSIANATGIDITSTEGLAQYVNQFTYLFPLDKSADIENLLMQGGSKSALKSSTPIITIGPTGIEFGRPGLIMNKYVDAAGVEQQRYGVTISQNFENTAFGKRLNKDSIAKLRPLLKKAVSNVRVENLKLNTPSVLIINAQGDTSTTSYLDTVKKSHKSNVISANIGTEENPKWVYTIQPTILFDTKFAGKLNTQQTAAAKTKPAPVPQTPTVVNAAQPVSKAVATSTSDIEAKKADIEKQIQELESETTTDQDTDFKGETKYYRSFNNKGELVETNNASPTLEPSLTQFKITVNENNPNEASFEYSGDKNAILLLSNNPNLLLASNSDFANTTDNADPSNYKISTIRKGLLEKTPTGWKIKRNMVVGFGDVSNELKSRYSQTKVDNSAKIAELKAELKELKDAQLALLDASNAAVAAAAAQRVVTPTNQPPTSSTDIEAKKADIERRRQEELEAYKLKKDGTPKTQAELTKVYAIEDVKNINAKYDAEIAALESTTTEPVTSADPIANLAEEILDTFSENISVVDGFITNIEDGTLSLKQLQEYGFETKDIALQAFNMAKKLHAERSKQVKTITLPNGKTVTINGNTKDSEAISDDSFDDALVTIPEDQVNTIVAEVSNLVISGIDPRTQDSVVSFIAADIMKQALASKEKGGKKSVETLPIFNKHKESFVELAKFYRENGLVNKAARLEALVDQFPKLQSIVNQYMATLTTGKVDENLELNEAEESVGLEKTVYSDDWTFTINSKSTASADLRKFFAFVEDRNEDGEVVENSLGFPEIIPFDQVYDTLHMILADKPADLDTMINSLELYKQAFPWLETVIENIENSPERIQNEFVSDMSKHHISMKYITWAKDKNGKYTLQRWSSNASSIEERLRNSWNSNLRAIGSNLVYTNEEDQYFFNPEVADDLIQQAAAWEKDPQAVTNDELAQWLGNFGIVLTDKTYEDLRAGKYNNSGKKPFTTLFTASTGLVKVLASELKKATSQQISVDEFNILKDSAVKALARLDALNTVGNYSNSFRAGGKTIYSYGNNNYLVNRMRDLTAYDGENKEFINQELIDELKSVSFTQDSLWLKNLTDEGPLGEFTRQNMGLDYLSLEALKQQNSRSRDNRKLNNLNTDEHEIVKLGMFFNGSKKIIDGKVYRQVSYFYPTMSDKTTMLVVNALAEDITVTTDGLAKANLESLYQALIMPEINRMRGYKTNKVAGYEPNYFYFLPGLNELNVEVNGVEQSFRDLVLSDSQTLFEPEVKQQLFDYLQETFDQIVEQKLADWDRLNVGKTIKDSNNRTTDEFTFLDKSYMSTHAKGIKNQKVYHAAADYVYNTLIANSEMMKLFTGDPALYAKFKKDATLQENLEASFINMGKRLAGDIAPGVELADSANNKYFQVFLKDKKVDSNNLKDSEQKAFFEKIEKDYGKNYKNIEGSDAQEYTTWKEHLYVLRQLGRLTAAQFDTLNQKLTQQSLGKINASTKLTFDEVGLVLQPMKPVYVGNLLSKQENVDRRVYVKSSSFPLIPEFTTGFQLDKVRQALEKFEQDNSTQLGPDGSQKFVRASFGTANKVGAVTNAVDVFDNDGNVIDDLSISAENVLELPRSNFRIQQDVPYKREKDQINVGTQERKLLFVNLLDVKVNSEKTGKDLLNTYNQAYEDLFKYAQEKLAKRLGLIEEVTGNNVLEEFNTMTVDPEVVNTVATKMDEISKIKSPIKKQTALQEFEDEIGQDNLERINFINQNFDSIVESLINSKINFFFDENNEFKNCD